MSRRPVTLEERERRARLRAVTVCSCITADQVNELAGRLDELDIPELLTVMSSALKASDALERGSRRCLPGCPTVADKERRRYAANRGAGLAHAHAARARNVGASGFTTGEQITARIAYYGGRCYLCGEPATTIDHVIPLARGGSNWPANLRPCCRSCNATKGRRLLAELPDELRPKRAR